MSVPANLSYFASKMDFGVSTQTFKLQPSQSGTQRAGQSVTFDLPSNVLLNLRSICMHFVASTGSTPAGGGARLPAKIESLIERISISAGGVQLNSAHNSWNVLRSVKDAAYGSLTPAATGHPSAVRNRNGHFAAVAGTDNEVYGDGDTPFTIHFWDSLLMTMEPSVIDTSLLPPITVTITFAGNEVLGSVAGVGLSGADAITADGTGGCFYEVKNLSMSCEVLSISSSVLSEITERRIADVGYVSLPFKNHYVFDAVHSSTTNFSVSTRSLDRVWVAYRAPGFRDQGGLVQRAGYKMSGMFAAVATGGHVTTDFGAHQFPLAPTNYEAYLTKPFVFSENAIGNHVYAPRFQLSINSSHTPNFQANFTEMLQMTRNSIERVELDINSLVEYSEQRFVQCWRFCLPGSDVRNASGLSTRELSAQCSLITSGLDPTTNVLIVGETTAELRVGSQKMCEVLN